MMDKLLAIDPAFLNGVTSATEDNEGNTPLHACAEAGNVYLEILVEHGLNKHARNRAGKTAALLAIENGHPYLAQILNDPSKDKAPSPEGSEKIFRIDPKPLIVKELASEYDHADYYQPEKLKQFENANQVQLESGAIFHKNVDPYATLRILNGEMVDQNEKIRERGYHDEM